MSAPAKILTASEPWAEYQLEDGTLLRFRFTACNFRRTGKQTAEDDPEYSFSQQVQVETHAPKQVAKMFALGDRPIGPGQAVHVKPKFADEDAANYAAHRKLGEANLATHLAHYADNGMPSDSPYCAPAEDCA